MRRKINELKHVIFFMCILVGMLLLSGCDKNSKDDTTMAQQDKIMEIEGATEPEDVQKEEPSVAEDIEEDGKETEQISDVDLNEYNVPDIINNNGHFVQIENKIYFHIVDADSMGRSALWAEYSDTECGRTVLCAYDIDSDKMETVAYDYTSGGISVQGKDIYLQAYVSTTDGQSYDKTVLSRYSYDNNVKLPDLLSNGDSILGAAPNGSYIATYHCDYSDDLPVQQISVYKNGELQDTVDVDDYCDCVAVTDEDVFYMCGQPEQGYTLMQINITSGETKVLGKLPDFENSDWNGHVDECIVSDTDIYFTYSVYEGTGHFFSEGYFVQASIGNEDSITYEAMPYKIIDGEPMVATFAVVDGRMIPSEGEPYTCKVQGNGDLGYYDGNGNWNLVANGWGAEFLNEEGDYKGVELAEFVNDSIYLIYNDNARVPDDDIGWRYAYCRNYTDVYRVSVKTGEAEQLVHQVAPWGE